MSIKINQSSCLMIDSQMSIRETIECMIEKKSSYVLIENQSEEIVGIFTDRDVMTRFFELKDDKLLSPITSVMHAPVHMLSLELIHKAPSIMGKLNIRHIPIYEQLEKKRNIVGVVTLKSLAQENLFKPRFENFLTQKYGPENKKSDLENLDLTKDSQIKKALGAPQTKIHIQLLSYDGGILRSLQTLYKEKEVSLSRFEPLEIETESFWEKNIKHKMTIIIDIDGYKRQEWAKVLQQLNHRQSRSPVFLVLQTNKHEADTLTRLKMIERNSWLHVYTKPLDLLTFSKDVCRLATTPDDSLASE